MNEMYVFQKNLNQAEMGLTLAELQGFLTGLLVNGSQVNWQKWLVEMMNDGSPVPSALLKNIKQEVEHLNQTLGSNELNYHFLFRTDNLMHEIEDLIGFVNHYLLGLALIQPHLDRLKGDLKEAITDLMAITKLTYDEKEDQIELANSFAEIKEYVIMVIFICFNHFNESHNETIH